jgi:hypothetical protein
MTAPLSRKKRNVLRSFEDGISVNGDKNTQNQERFAKSKPEGGEGRMPAELAFSKSESQTRSKPKREPLLKGKSDTPHSILQYNQSTTAKHKKQNQNPPELAEKLL